MFRVLHDRASNVSPGLLPCACPAGVLGRGLCEIQAGTNKEKGLIMSYQYTTQKALRAEFKTLATEWGLSLKRLSSGGYCCTARCAFVDWIDGLQKDRAISEALAYRVTLR